MHSVIHNLAAEIARAFWRFRAAFVLIGLLALVEWAWSGTLSATWVYDDFPTVVDNEALDGSLAAALATHENVTSARPPIGVLFWTEHRLFGHQAGGWHLVGVAGHAGCTVLVFLAARRMLGFAASAATAALWAVHPLTTSAVIPVAQQCETLACLGALAAFWFYSGGPALWRQAAALAALALSLWSKQAFILMPLILALWSWTWERGHCRLKIVDCRMQARPAGRGLKSAFFNLQSAIGVRPVFWLGCLAGGAASLWAWRELVGFALSGGYAAGQIWACPPWQYLWSECAVAGHYLGLAFWPRSLCFDYWWQPMPFLTALPWVVAAALAMLVVADGLRGRRRLAWAAAAFLLLLAPTSTVIPLADLCVEHRMYLPLALVIGAVTGTVSAIVGPIIFWFGGRARLGAAAGLGAACLGLLILGVVGVGDRIAVYRDVALFWFDTTEKAPLNSRAWTNLGAHLLMVGRVGEAEVVLRKAVDLDPTNVTAWVDLSVASMRRGAVPAAWVAATNATRLDDQDPRGWHALGMAEVARGRIREALEAFRAGEAVDPGNENLRHNRQAVAALAELLAIKPARPDLAGGKDAP